MSSQAPFLSAPLIDRVLQQLGSYAFRIYNFVDYDTPELSYTASLGDGSPLPSWITFDPAIQRFAVTPPDSFLGTLDIKVTASDGTASASGDFTLQITPPNSPPVLAQPLPDRDAVTGEQFDFRLPDGTFTDADGTNLFYTTVLSDGGALPGWLSFNSGTGLFEGTPPSGQTGEYDITVTATDGLAAATASFHLSVRASDAAPIATPIGGQSVAEETPWTFTLPPGAFTDPDSTGLVYRAAMADGLPLPTWLRFDPLTRTFSGTPEKDFTGALNLAVTADDGSRVATQVFALTVTNVEDAPRLVIPLHDQLVQEDTAFAFGQFVSGDFIDPDGDPITYTVTRDDGGPLPSWLNVIDIGLKISFNGTPPKDFNGTIPIRITASDGTLSTSDVFNLTFAPVNDAPVLAVQTPSFRVTPGTPFLLALPAGTFTDVDSPVLTYSATQADGAPLPAWLSFNPATRSFSGTPPAGFAGLTVTVSAADEISRASETFALATGAPLLLHPLADQTLVLGNTWRYGFAADTFQDLDTANLAYSATLADGSALPGWLHFDPTTRTFTGQAPADWNGHADIRVTASDGGSSASDVFALDELGDFSFAVSGSAWGRSAPAEIHYRFDPLYYEIGNSWSVGFSEDFSAGPLYGGVSASVGFGYNFQAGVLMDLTLRPDSFDLAANFRITETRSSPDQAIGTAPFVIVGAVFEASSHFNVTAADEAFALHAFAGITATIGAQLSASVHGGFRFPDIDLGPFGTISVPDITASAGINLPIDFIGIGKIEIADGQITMPSNGIIGGIDVNIHSGDPVYDVHLAQKINDDWGKLSFLAPTGFTISDYTLLPATAGNIGAMRVSAVSDPIASASADVDKMVTELVKALHPEIDLEKLFHPRLPFETGIGTIGLGVDNDFSLVGDVSLKEEMTFTPSVHYVMTTSYGQTVYGQEGDKTSFDTPEGEGSFQVDASYTADATLTTVISLVGTMHFDISLLAAALDVKIGESPIDITFPIASATPVYSDTLSIFGISIPIYSNTDYYQLDQTRQDSFFLDYEKFRTVFGSGDSFALTTHQVTADGNDHDNVFTGNALDNVINTFGGNDTIDAGAGNDTVDAGAGNDYVYAGPGDDVFMGGDGIDTIDYSAAPGPVTVTLDGFGNDGWGGLDTVSGFENALGSAFDDLMFGNFDPNVLVGGDGNDIMLGDGGNDTLYGGNGNDSLSGGPGDDALFGGNGDDSLRGGAGSDVLYGGSGTNTMAGGTGDDQYVVESATDTVTENPDEGTDTVYVGVNGWTLPANVEIVRLFGQGSAITGGAGDEIIVANPLLASTIDAGEGNDTLWGGGPLAHTLNGGAGDDIIRGQDSPDVMIGGTGNDQFVIGNLAATIVEKPNEGIDTAWLAVNGWTNFANVEIARLAAPGAVLLFGSDGNEDLVANQAAASRIDGNGGNDTLWGSAFADTLNGGAGDDILRGQGGADVMAGGTGNDQYVVFDPGATVIENANEGYDIVYYTGAGSFFIGDNVEEGRLAASGTGLVGNALGNLLVGNNAGLGSTLNGAGGDDIIFGTPGADIFTGGAGNDTMYSLGGADRFLYDAPGWGVDQIAGFSSAAGDKLEFLAGSGVTGFDQINLNIAGGNTQVNHANGVILVFGAVLSASDFLFG